MQKILGIISFGFLLSMLYSNSTRARNLVPFSLNGKQYYVSDKKSKLKKKKAATVLAELEEVKNKLCMRLGNSKYKHDGGVKRLLAKKDVRIEERSETFAKQVAYSVNKGSFIGICLDTSNMNAMIFVLLHELAHIMCTTYAHNQEFWDNFALLIKAAEEFKMYKHVRYDKKPTTFCGTVISHTPYKK
jgi:hypothetical protein